MSIHTRVEALLGRLASEPQFPTQGETIFVDLERQDVRRAYIPRRVVTTLLGGRGVNMFLLHNLLDETLEPIHPDVPLIFGTGILTSMVHQTQIPPGDYMLDASFSEIAQVVAEAMRVVVEKTGGNYVRGTR